ncbi:PucR family transcriptional regulator [Nocardia sp. NPDC059240]|uniref:PucR family transcriptional regulator n=1 Tax=Nocardia sp. NPDC059240 TaxID=3346786 RepID=UPI00369857D5
MEPHHRDVLKVLHERALAFLDSYSAESPVFSELPQTVVDVDFVPSIVRNLELLFGFLADGIEPDESETSGLLERARAVVRDGMTVDVVLRNYRFGVAFIWSQLLEAATDSERDTMLAAAVPLAHYLSIITERVTIGCLPSTPDPHWEQLERRRGIADALLAGSDPLEWAEAPAIPVASAFLVTVLRAGDPGPGTMTALRNRMHEIPGSFMRLDSGGWTALIPLDPDDDGTAAAERLATVLNAFASTPPEFWVGVVTAATRSAVPAAHGQARVLGELGRCLGSPEILCRRDRFVLEFALAVSGPACARLAQVLDALDDQPLLAETLDVYLDLGFNQLAAGRTLNVHRNTVTYRLTRICELTGLDPQDPAGLTTLSAARLARRLVAKGFTA